LLVNDRKEIETLGYHLSSNLFGYRLNSSVMVGTVPVSLNLSISLREEVGLQSSSDALDTHNPNTQGGLKRCCVYKKRSIDCFAISDLDSKIINTTLNIKKDYIRLNARATTLTERRMAHSSTGQAAVVPCA